MNARWSVPGSKAAIRFHRARYGEAASWAWRATTRRTASTTGNFSRRRSSCRPRVARLSCRAVSFNRASIWPPEIDLGQPCDAERLRELAAVVRVVGQQPLQDRRPRVDLAVVAVPALDLLG